MTRFQTVLFFLYAVNSSSKPLSCNARNISADVLNAVIIGLMNSNTVELCLFGTVHF